VESTPAVTPLTGRPATIPAYASQSSAELSCRLLARLLLGLFARGGGGFNHRALGGANPLPVQAEARTRLRRMAQEPGV
jgi:hypothetical protein